LISHLRHLRLTRQPHRTAPIRGSKVNNLDLTAKDTNATLAS
jgi:hypothetical protein